MSWREVLRALWGRFWKDKVLDQAAILSFYFILSFFPLLLFLIALLGLMLQTGPALYETIHDYLTKLVPASASALINSTLLQVRRGSGGGTLSVSLLFSLYMASSGVAALMDALNVANEVAESRSWWKQRLVALALTIGATLFIALALILLGFGDQLARLVAGHHAVDRLVILGLEGAQMVAGTGVPIDGEQFALSLCPQPKTSRVALADAGHRPRSSTLDAGFLCV